MKRSIAAIGAAVVGLSGAVVAATPAQAATTPDCTTSADNSTIADNAPADSFFLECVPQYGFGKADLTVQNPEGISSEFSIYDAEDATISSSFGSAEVSAYYSNFPLSTESGVVSFNGTASSSTATSQFYEDVTPILKIQSAAKIKTSALPASCKSSKVAYDGAYKVTYLPGSITVDTTPGSGQTIDGAPGKFFYAVRPNDLYLGLNFSTDSDGNRQFDADAALCWASGRDSGYAANGTGANQVDWQNISSVAFGLKPVIAVQASSLVPIGAPATITVSSSVGYGTPGLPVKVSGVATDGVISATVDGIAGDPSTIVDGSSKARIPSTLTIGKHEVVLAYSGDKGQDEGTRSTTFTVKKGATVTNLKLNKTKATKKSTRLVASTTVTVPGTAVTASGKVAFSVNGKVVKTVTLKNGKATGTLPAFTKKGTAKVVATYLGSSKLAKDAAPTVKVTVK